MKRKVLLCSFVLVLVFASSAMAFKNPVLLEAQGSFTAGGSVIKRSGDFTNPLSEAGQTIHGDHAYVFWQRPVNAKKYPLVFLHGAGSSGQVWETTPDGRDGYQNIFLEKGYSTYIVDQPRRGRAGKATVDGNIKAFASEQTSFNVGRLGIWPGKFENVQISFDAEAWNQHFRNSTPNTGAFDADMISDAIAKVFDRTSEAVPIEKFMALTRIPILLIYGGNIPEEISDKWGQDNWRVRLKMARLWVEAVNRHGGDATLIYLPDLGINGNTHSLFSDLNNAQLADIQEKWMNENNF